MEIGAVGPHYQQEFLKLTTREWQCHDQACGELNIRVRLGLFFETAPQMTDRFHVSK